MVRYEVPLGAFNARNLTITATLNYQSIPPYFLNDRFTQLGVLEAAVDTTRADHCKSWASCVEWYGNARPLFVGQRVFALMGYELVEGVLKDRRIQEVRRVDFGGSQAPLR